MTEGRVALEQLTASIKERMQQARQVCPFFQLEQRAVESPAQAGREPEALLRQIVLPEISVSGLAGAPLKWSLEQQLELCQDFEALIVNIEGSFFNGSPALLKRLRQQFPQRYLIARDLVMDEYQILQARMAGANALILSNALLGIRRTQLYLGKIRFWEMEPMLEIHSLEDLRLLRELKVRVVLLAPGPGNTQFWKPADLAEACRQLRELQLLICTGTDPALVKDLAAEGVRAVAPGWPLWEQDDPQGILADLAQAWSVS